MELNRARSGVVTTTESGIEIEPVYGPSDGRVDPSIGAPGEFPFTRGIHADMYRTKLWTSRQYSGYGDPSATNERFRSLIRDGNTGLSVAFDLPTQLDRDSDDPIARPEVGRVGVTVDTLADLEAIFEGIPLDVASPSFTINAPAPVIGAMYVAMAKRRGVDLQKLRATFQNDILKEFVTRGAYVFPADKSLKLVVDVIEYFSAEAPSIYPISVCGSHIRDTGATGLDALGITLADGLAYLEAACDRGLDPSDVARRFSFLFCARQDPFEEAAQIRAARRLWARMLKERFGITDPAALKFRLFSASSNQMCTRQEPLNNIVRGTLGGLGIILGGAQAVMIACYDEAFDIPSVESQRVALRTQQIIAYESCVPATVDPLAGSYFVEALTDESEKRLVALISEVDARGGMVEAVSDGWVQRRMYDRAYELARGIEGGEVPVVGVNMFAVEEGGGGDAQLFALDDAPMHEVDAGVLERQLERLRQHHASRDSDAARRALGEVRAAAETGANVMWPLEAAVSAGATVGECMGVLREVYGEYREGGQF